MKTTVEHEIISFLLHMKDSAIRTSSYMPRKRNYYLNHVTCPSPYCSDLAATIADRFGCEILMIEPDPLVTYHRPCI